MVGGQSLLICRPRARLTENRRLTTLYYQTNPTPQPSLTLVISERTTKSSHEKDRRINPILTTFWPYSAHLGRLIWPETPLPREPRRGKYAPEPSSAICNVQSAIPPPSRLANS